MLEELITTHRLELIKRCSKNAAERNESSTADADLFQHGVPLFLNQLVDTLRKERQAGNDHLRNPDSVPASSAIGQAAALHGADLLLQGYDIVISMRRSRRTNFAPSTAVSTTPLGTR